MTPQAFPERIDGYRGIWFALGFSFEYGDKYTGGLGTYTANHQPTAVFAPEVSKTFFVYGGTPSADQRQLLVMVSFYDHRAHQVPRPRVVHADAGVDDPHDNASLQIDAGGYLWVFKSGRNTTRPGFIYRSAAPHDISRFEATWSGTITYPQAWYNPDKGFLLLHTQYTRGRELYYKTSKEGTVWTEPKKLAGFDGHYQVSAYHQGKVATFFNWHPDGDNDKRTNVYYAQTTDHGETWTTADGRRLTLPLNTSDNAALVVDLQRREHCMYTCDINFDRSGNPILLYIVSRAGEPGPKGDPREWTLLHWTGTEWLTRVITNSDHNYDMGSLHVEGTRWRVIGPTATGPQRYATGGEIEQWVSTDEGRTWQREAVVTRGSVYNHSYARRAVPAANPFYTFWADGHANQLTPSRLYFANADASRFWMLPYDMTTEYATPKEVTLPSN